MGLIFIICGPYPIGGGESLLMLKEVKHLEYLKMPISILFLLHKIYFFSLRLTLHNVELAALQENVWQYAAIP